MTDYNLMKANLLWKNVILLSKNIITLYMFIYVVLTRFAFQKSLRNYIHDLFKLYEHATNNSTFAPNQ